MLLLGETAAALILAPVVTVAIPAAIQAATEEVPGAVPAAAVAEVVAEAVAAANPVTAAKIRFAIHPPDQSGIRAAR